jgi:hypothetical protein
MCCLVLSTMMVRWTQEKANTIEPLSRWALCAGMAVHAWLFFWPTCLRCIRIGKNVYKNKEGGERYVCVSDWGCEGTERDLHRGKERDHSCVALAHALCDSKIDARMLVSCWADTGEIRSVAGESHYYPSGSKSHILQIPLLLPWLQFSLCLRLFFLCLPSLLFHSTKIFSLVDCTATIYLFNPDRSVQKQLKWRR